MNNKGNLEVLNPFETLIITNPNCFDTIIVGRKNDKLIIRNFCNEDACDETLNKHLEGLSCIYRDIEFTGRINILANEGFNKPLLFKIEETTKGLMIRPIRKNRLKQNQELLNR